MSESTQKSSWFNRGWQSLSRKRASSRARRGVHLQVEALEDRNLLATLNIASGVLTYTAAVGEANQLRVTSVNGVLTFAEAPGINITLSGAGAAGWTGDGTNRVSGPSSSVSATASMNFQDLDDKLTLQSFPISAVTVDGGAGSDTLSRAGATPAAGDAWNITDPNAGNITSVVAGFANIESLVGGGKAETFSVDDTGSLAGSIDGGGAAGGTGQNILDYSGSSPAVTFNLAAKTAVNSTDTIPFNRINGFVGSSSPSDVLIGSNAANNWGINASNGGNLTIAGTNNFAFFSGIENLTGGNGADTFFIVDGGSLSGVINGAGGTRNALDYTSWSTAVNVNLTTNSIPNVSGGVLNIQDVTGTGQNDTLIGNSSANILNGYFGADLIFGEGGNDTLNGGFGNDDDYLDGGAGVNVLQARVSNVLLVLTDDYTSDFSSSDTLVDIQQAIVIGTTGSDTIDATQFSGALTVDGDEGPDIISGGTGTNTLNGGGGDDVITGGPAADVLNGGAGNDSLSGGAGNDGYVFDTDTNQGNDTIEDSAGTADRVSFFPSTKLGATLSLAITGEQTVNANLTLTLSAIENAIGSAKDDILFGNGVANLLKGGDGNDILVGNGGADTLQGENGLDILIGGFGGDILSGGVGNDVLIGGTTSFDGNVTALNALMAEWASGNSYSLRISRLSGASSGGLNGGFSLHAGTDPTVFDDAIADTLNGDDNFDWFLARAGDTTDKTASETLTTI